MIKAVIFDLDGVVVDTEPVWFETYSRVCHEYGFTFTKELDRLAKGRSDGVKYLTAALGIPERWAEFSEEVRKVYKDIFWRKAKLMSGSIKILTELKDSYRLGLATSAYQDRLDFNLEKFPQLRSVFTIIVSRDEVKNGKPAPDIFLLAAKKLGVRPEECVVIEDAETGVIAAKVAGMKVIGFKPSHVTPQDLSEADKVVSALSEINSSGF